MKLVQTHRSIAISLIVLSLFSLYALLFIGSYSIDFKKLFLESSQFEQLILWQIRLPRILAALLVGGALAVSGHLLQLVLHNALAEPGVLGVSTGAALAVIVSMLFLPDYGVSSWVLHYRLLISLLGAIAILAMIIIFSFYLGQGSSLSLILVGIGLSTSLSAVGSWLIFYSNNEELRLFSLWFLGSFSGIQLQQLILPGFIITLCWWYSLRSAAKWNSFYLGEKQAALYGVEPQKLRYQALILVCLLSASAVAIGGILPFVGLIIPHLIRSNFGLVHPYLIGLLIIFGALFLLLTDSIARGMVTNEFPLGLLTATMGGPMMVFIIWKNRSVR